MSLQRFDSGQPRRRANWADAVILVGLAAVLYVGTRLAMGAPATIAGAAISPAPTALPWYAALSVARMLAAYLLSLAFSFVYGGLAARNQRAEQVLMPLLDILQSVPILSFLPVVFLSLSTLFSPRIAAEAASVVLIFTSQVWNLTFSWYQSLTTQPRELREVTRIFRFNGWLRFRFLDLPFAGIGLIWNSVMSWAGGWFFLMAAEAFTLGGRDFRLPGLGSYLHEAANRGETGAIVWGLAALVVVIIGLDQLVWRPLLVWSERLSLETVEGGASSSSWFYDVLRKAQIVDFMATKVWGPVVERLDSAFLRLRPQTGEASGSGRGAQLVSWALQAAALVAVAYGGYRVLGMLLTVPVPQWRDIGVGIGATTLRVAVALTIAVAWTVPLGVLMGANPARGALLQPLAQVLASIPATALFPVFLLVLLGLPGGLNLAAVLLMLAGSQWYLLFNVIAGASAIPADLKDTASLLQLKGWARWRTLVLPALFPYIVTGAITASGGAWNASIVAEYVSFGGQVHSTVGVGALISGATAGGDYPLVLAATVTMVTVVVLINRLLWRRLYRLAEEKYRLE